MFDRIAPVYDVMNRVMTAGLDQRWRRIDGPRRRPSGRRPCSTRPAAPATSRSSPRRPVRRHRPRLLGADARARAPQGAGARVGAAATCSRSRSRTSPSTRRRSASASATLRISGVDRASCARVLRPGGRLGDPRDHAPARAAAGLLLALVRPDRSAARQGAARRRGVRVSPGEREAVSRTLSLAAHMARRLRERRGADVRGRNRRAAHGQ